MTAPVAAPSALVRMVNQIAANYGHLPADEAAERVAEHLRLFWAPAMRSQLAAWVRQGGEGLDPVSTDAVTRVTN